MKQTYTPDDLASAAKVAFLKQPSIVKLTRAEVQYLKTVLADVLTQLQKEKKQTSHNIRSLWDVCDPSNQSYSNQVNYADLNSQKDYFRYLHKNEQKMKNIQTKFKRMLSSYK